MRRARIGSIVGLWLGLAALLAAPAAAQGGPEWEAGGRARAYARGLFGPGALVGIAGSTALDQAGKDPTEWGDDAGGFGRRLASNAGRNAVEETIRHGLAAAMRRSVVYQRCGCRDVGGRIEHAWLEAITDRNRAGDRMLSLPRLAGAYGGALAERGWRPDREPIDVVAIGTGTILFAGLSNLWREFVGWP